MKWLSLKTIITIILLIAMSLTGGLSCYQDTGEDSTATDNRPFYPDRVVTVRITMTREDWEFLKSNAIAEQYVKADLWYDGELIPDIAIRPKGNSSLMTAALIGTSRFSLKVDLNFFNSARNLYGVKKLNFNNGFSDPTLIREFLAYELFEQMGVPTPRASFVDLWINDTHLGLYTMVEQIDKTFLSDHFVDNTGNLYKPEMPAAYLSWTEEDFEKQQQSGRITTQDEMDVNLGGGKLEEIIQALEPKEADGQPDTSTQFPNELPGIMPPRGLRPPEGFELPEGFEPPEGFELPEGFEPPEGFELPGGFRPPEGIRLPGMPGTQQGNFLALMGLKTNENKPDHSLLFRFLDILNNEPDETFPAEIEKVLDVDEVLRFLAVSTLIVHLDNYIAMGHNYYLYEDNGRFIIIPWDLNMAFATFNFGLNREQLINYYIDEPTGGAVEERPLVQRLLTHQPYLDAYHGYLDELLDGPFDIDVMNSRIDELAALIRPYVETDELKFYSTRQFEIGLERDITQAWGMNMGASPLGLKSFIEERSESVREQLEGKRKSSSGDGSGNGGRFGIGFNLPRQPRR